MMSPKRMAMIAAVALVALYLVANYTSAETAGKLGLTYQV